MLSKKAILCFFTPIWLISVAQGQGISPTMDHYLDLIRRKFSGEKAYQTTAFVADRWRLPGNSGFKESIHYVRQILEEAGFQNTDAETDFPLTYRIETYPLRQPAWEPVDAELSLLSDQQPILSFQSNRNMIAINSFSTPEAGVVAEVIVLDHCSEAALEGKNLSGKIVLANCSSLPLFKLAVEKHGALGVLSYSIPDYNQPKKYVTAIPFQTVPLNNKQKSWCINLSFDAYQKLMAQYRKGPFKVRVNIKTKIYPSEELALIAEIKGKTRPEERFVLSAHVQEPGANDNASGVGVLAEMARVAADFLKKKEVSPDRTITFLWGVEIGATHRYIQQDKQRAKGIRWGISLDMVGENTEKTGGTFLIEKMPDPSAIWTRGEDQHTEWGASPVDKSQFHPHYFNDLMAFLCQRQGSFAGWKVKTNPFEGGSDHVPFLDAGIPGLLLWHFTDVFYHTDADRIDKVSSTTLANVGAGALACVFFLCNPTEETAMDILRITETAALKRIQTERELSLLALLKGGNLEEEQEIIKAWSDWYLQAIGSIRDVLIVPPSIYLEQALNLGTQKVKQEVLTTDKILAK